VRTAAEARSAGGGVTGDGVSTSSIVKELGGSELRTVFRVGDRGSPHREDLAVSGGGSMGTWGRNFFIYFFKIILQNYTTD
jgi:hypothetical protein